MTCTRAQILALISYIRKEVATARSLEEAVERIDRIYDAVESMAAADVVRELGL